VLTSPRKRRGRRKKGGVIFPSGSNVILPQLSYCRGGTAIIKNEKGKPGNVRKKRGKNRFFHGGSSVSRDSLPLLRQEEKGAGVTHLLRESEEGGKNGTNSPSVRRGGGEESALTPFS